ncbi:hypothetical protein DFJ73DRAFT_798767 [Zopfochytrium polystomum]|nr:hypothetical protein DFJ73DRAFT_798767 [Zopfochytrium polystomum]
MPFLKLQHNSDHGSSPLAGKRPPSDSNGFPATPVETVGDGVYKRGKSQTRWDILKSSAKSVATGAANDGLGVANGLAVGAVGTAVTAVAGRTAGAAAKIGTGAALGAIEEAGKALEKKNSFKIPDRVKFPLVSIGNSLASGKSGTDALTAGADALSGTAPKLTPKKAAGKIAEAAAEGIANKVVPLAAAGVTTAFAGPVAGAAAGVGTAAVMGFAEGVGHEVLKDGVGRMGEVAVNAIPGGAIAKAGVAAASKDAKNGLPVGRIIEHGVSAAAGAAVGQMATTAGAPAALKAPIANAVSGTINGVVDTIAGPPPLGKAGKKLQQAAKKAGKAALAVGEMKGKVTAARIDKGRANAGAAKELAKSEAAAKKEAARTSSATASGTGLKSQTKGAKDTHASAPSAGTIWAPSSASFETLNDCSYNNQLKDQPADSDPAPIARVELFHEEPTPKSASLHAPS